MQFNPKAYGPAVSDILAIDGDGDRLMPLVHSPCTSPAAKTAIDALAASKSIHTAAVAGLYLYFSCWDEAHELAQRVETPER